VFVFFLFGWGGGGGWVLFFFFWLWVGCYFVKWLFGSVGLFLVMWGLCFFFLQSYDPAPTDHATSPPQKKGPSPRRNWQPSEGQSRFEANLVDIKIYRRQTEKREKKRFHLYSTSNSK